MKRSGIKLIVAGILAVFGPLLGVESRVFGSFIPIGIVAIIIGAVLIVASNDYSGGYSSSNKSSSGKSTGSDVFGSAYNKET